MKTINRKYVKIFFLVLIVALVGIILAFSFSAFTASNIVLNSRVGSAASIIDANAIKPPECASINVTNVVYCNGGVCNGTNANDLILGSIGNDSIRGKKGIDCILGGGGDDDLIGGSGNDVCLGGPGTDTFSNCMVTYQ